MTARQTSDLHAPEWAVAYTYKPHYPFGYTIRFEDDTILGWRLLERDAKYMVGLLNGAYNLGRSSMAFEPRL